MELFPIYDENSKISKNLWYSISALGDSPLMRVGHTIVHKKFNSDSKGKFYIVGGANPSNSFNDVYTLDMDTLSWDKYDEDLENFPKGRYEHSCMLHDDSIYIFGGSNEDGSLNDVFKINTDENKIEKILNSSTNCPTPRTIHVGANLKNQLVIFGGGIEGKSPIQDKKVYIYNTSSNKWIALSINGKNPEYRQGHLMIGHDDSEIYLHGGMNEEGIFDDFWVLNLKKMTWAQVDQDQNNRPSGRAAHGGISVNNNLYIFGGIGETGLALDDLWKYDLNQNQWSLIEIFGYKPPSRLDFAYCKATFKTSDNDEENENEDNLKVESEKNFFVIHGGMDTEGNVFDDIFMISLE
ncbi:unnamed protein product [Brachionus calyciflorus]|uniref:Rab9 effector protein with kelch motifs n=1 Tax=Brachionus calyciflorus TaxID=104777 RepID=A0A813UDW3_9BILA|nr:unnamed protein product [Brachionus calyciflorus]